MWVFYYESCDPIGCYLRCRSEARLVRSARAMLRRAASRAALALARRDVAPLDGFGFDGWRVASRSFASDGSKRKQPVNPVWRVVEDEVTTQPRKPEPPKPQQPEPTPPPTNTTPTCKDSLRMDYLLDPKKSVSIEQLAALVSS